MQKTLNIAMIIAIVVVAFLAISKDSKIGGTTNFDSLELSGVLTAATGAFADVTASDDLTVSGTGTFADMPKVSYSTSTLQIGNTASGVGPGCLVLGSSSGSTTVPVYITATGTTITATTTRPNICDNN